MYPHEGPRDGPRRLLTRVKTNVQKYGAHVYKYGAHVQKSARAEGRTCRRAHVRKGARLSDYDL